MAHSTKSIVLTLLIIAFAGTSFAQMFANTDRHIATQLRYNKQNSEIDIQNNTAFGNSGLARNYMRSEQFVFDNLTSLKKEYIISDIYYDLDNATIRPDALPVLDALVDLLIEQSNISVAVTAHCDSRMLKYNEVLAIRRAEAAQAYLVLKGISPSRIVLEKHGRPSVKNPCTDNPDCSIAVQQLNRRTEFNIIYNDINLAHLSSFND